MAFSDIRSRIQIIGFSAEEEAQIVQALERLYRDEIPTAKFVLDLLLSSSSPLEIKYVEGVATAITNEFKVSFDVNYPSNHRYYDKNGNLRTYTIEDVLIHEIFHAVAGLEDPERSSLNDPSADFEGLAVKQTNYVMEEYGLNWERAGYFGTPTQGESVPDNATFGRKIDFAYIAYADLSGNKVGIDRSGDARDFLLITTDTAGDAIKGGAGANYIYAGGGADKIYGGAGEDYLFGEAGNDELFGGSGRDWLKGGANADKFYVGNRDVILDSDETDRIFKVEFGEDDTVEDASGYRQLEQPVIDNFFLEFADLDGNYLWGYNQFYFGQMDGGGAIYINTGTSLVVLWGQDWTKPTYNIVAKNYQTGDFGLDIFDPTKYAREARAHYETIKYGYEEDRFILTPYLEFLKEALRLDKETNQPSSAGRSMLQTQAQSINEISGTEDIDFLQGTSVDDDIRGGADMDLLLGGSGSDIYRYAAGDGDDYIMDYDGQGADVDVLAFDDLNLSDVELSGGGADLYIKVLGTHEATITVIDQFADGNLDGLEEIRFADGAVLTRSQLIEALMAVRGTSGDDELYSKGQQINGQWLQSVFYGGQGHDHIYAGDGRDTYVYARGDGNDTIEDYGEGIGTLKFTDLNPADVSLVRLTDNTIIITIGSTGEWIRIEPGDDGIGFDEVRFEDGTVWDSEDILAAAVSPPTGANLNGDTIVENASAGAVVGTIVGIDPDPNAVLTYALLLDAGGRFVIDATSGQISVAEGAILDFESLPSLLISVAVTNAAGLTYQEAFYINVADVNERPSVSNLNGNSVDENGANGTVVGTVDASDPDAGDALTYTLADDAGGRFSIDAQTGQITVVNSALIDYEVATSHEVTVVVIDSGGLTSTQTFRISVIDQNETGNNAPTDAVLTGGTVSENAVTGTEVGVIAGIDLDQNATLSYALIDDAGGRFSIDPITGRIVVADPALLNFEANTSHNVTVRLTDNGGLTFEKSFTLHVTDVNEAPVSAEITGGTVVEKATNGTVVGVVTGVDPDVGATLSYSLVNNAGGRFAINSVTGEITVADGDLLDYDVASSHDITVRVIDQGGLAVEKVFVVVVANGDVNHAPTGGTLSGSTIVEKASNGAFVGIVAGIDPDSGSLLTYSLVDDAGGRFAIDVNSGRLTVANGQLLDFDAATSHAVVVRITDQGGLTFDKEFIIQVSDAVGPTLTGTEEPETLTGTAEGEIIDGRGGNDTLRGLGGGDTYIFGAGSGNDVILEVAADTGTDVIQLTALTAADVTFRRSGNDLFIKINSTNDELRVENQFDGSPRIEQVRFADGVVWNAAQISNAAWIRGTSSGDTIWGSNDSDIIDGLGGNDELIGQAGNDTYVFREGSGFDTIRDFNSAGVDAVRLEGLTADDVSFRRSGNDLYIKITASGEELRVENQFTGSAGIQFVHFADGTSLNAEMIKSYAWIRGTASGEALWGTSDNDTIDGLGGNDELFGQGGSDTYVYRAGAGFDTIKEDKNAVDTDLLVLEGLSSSDVTFRRAGNDLFIKINASGEELRVENQFDTTRIERVKFGDGVEWGAAQMLAAAWFRGTSEGEVIWGSGDADVFDGGGGNDNLRGREGSDTYIYGIGSGNDVVGEDANVAGTDVIRLVNLNASDVTFRRAGNDLFIKINASGEELRVENQFDTATRVEEVHFANGEIWDAVQIQAAAWYRGTSNGEVIWGSGDNDIIDGMGGDDNLRGGGGSDTYIFGIGSGNDIIGEDANAVGTDVVRLTAIPQAAVTFSRSGNDLYIRLNPSGEQLRIENQFDTNARIEKIEFSDGSVSDVAQMAAAAWWRGSSANDILHGSGDSDTLWGSTGSDYLRGVGGSDTYVYARGDGSDEINDDAQSTSDIDVLRFTDLNTGDVTLSRVGNDLAIAINGTTDLIRIDNQFRSSVENWGVEKIQFANGTTWELATINANAWLRGSSGNETINGSSWNDTIEGDAGNDQLSGGAGADVFVFRSGSGQDIVTDFSIGQDKLEFRDGIFSGAEEALASASALGNDTLITIDPDTTILLQNVAFANLQVDDFRVV